MSTAVLNKTKIEAKWTPEKLQQEAAQAIIGGWATAMKIFEKMGPEAVGEYERAMLEHKVEMYKKLNVKTPVELVKAMAEHEANLFGSKIVVWGDETEAKMEYETCGCWETMQKLMPMTPEMEKKMGEGWTKSIQMMAKALGFKGEVQMGEKTSVITFTKGHGGSCCGG